jgi:hypothetical protein
MKRRAFIDPIAAVHESVNGASQTFRDVRAMSAIEGKPEAICSGRAFHLTFQQSYGRTAFANLIVRPDGADRVSLGPRFDSLKAYQRCSQSAPAGKQ